MQTSVLPTEILVVYNIYVLKSFKTKKYERKSRPFYQDILALCFTKYVRDDESAVLTSMFRLSMAKYYPHFS